jgi:carboxymethylenebutenolidase
MQEQHFDLTTAAGEMPTWVIRPDEGGPHPLVLFLMDAPGMRPEIRHMASRLATSGYYVMTSQLYYRQVREFNVFETGDRDRMFELMNGLSNQMVNEDAGSMIAHAATDPAASTERVGVVGYCMSGPFAVMVAAAHLNVRAAASFHGVRLVADAPDSPHLHLDKINGEVYIGAAETDHYAPPEMIDAFAAALEASNATGRVEWYPGTEHGFAYQERPQYDRVASERHWERMHDLFRRNLHG